MGTVTRRHRAKAPIEDRSETSKFFDSRVLANLVVVRNRRVIFWRQKNGGNLLRQYCPCGRGFLVTSQSEFVLRFPADLVFLRHLFCRFSHGEAGGRLSNRRQFGKQVSHAKSFERSELLAHAFCAAGLKEHGAKSPAKEHRNIRNRLGAPGEDTFRVTDEYFFGRACNRGIARGASADDRVSRRRRRNTDREGNLSRDVGFLHRGDCDSEDYLVNVLCAHFRPVEEFGRGQFSEIYRIEISIDCSGAPEGYTRSGNQSHPLGVAVVLTHPKASISPQRRGS